MLLGLGPNRFGMGEITPLLWTRYDLAKYGVAAKRLENFVPTLQGPIRRRGGTRHVARANNGANPVALIPFVRDDDHVFLVELGHNYARFYKNGAPVMDGASPYQIATPWPDSSLFDSRGLMRLKYVQSADVLYIVCPTQAPRKLMRYGDTDWRIQAMANWAPRPHPGAITLWRERLCLAAGNTLYMSQAGAFENFEVSIRAVPEATGYFYAAGVSLIINNENGAITWTSAAEPPWVVTVGWPADEASARQVGSNNYVITPVDPEKGVSRIGFQATNVPRIDVAVNSLTGQLTVKFQDTLRFSLEVDPQKTSIYADDATTSSEAEIFGYIVRGAETAVAADDPVEINVYSDTADDIEWLLPANNLLVGTTGSEFVVGETAAAEPFGPENCKVAPSSSFGSAPLQALRVGSTALFLQRLGRKLREFVYDYSSDAYIALDLTVTAEHITRGGVTGLAWQGEPIECLWLVRGDGQLIGFTYSRDQEMSAWHRHILGGGGRVSQVACLPSPAGEQDELWLSVKRVIDGRTVYYLERLEPGHELGGDVADAFFVDSGKTVTGTGLTQVTGLEHLEGLEVHILADGGVQPPQVVTGGAVPLKYPADKVQVGLPYTSLVTTVNLEAAMRDGPMAGRVKRIVRARLQLLESLGGAAGYDETELDQLEYRTGGLPMNRPVPLFSGQYPVPWPHGWEDEGQLTVAQTYPLPFCLAAITADVAVEGRN